MTASFDSVDGMLESLIREYRDLPRNPEVDDSILEKLFQDEKYHLVILALENGFALTPEIESKMISSADLLLYEYLYKQNKLPRVQDLAIKAVKKEKLDTLQWLKSKEYPFNSTTINSWAAFNGNIEILTWVREAVASWDHFTVLNAIFGGQLETTQYLLERGCPWNKTRSLLTAEKFTNIKEWLLASGSKYQSQEISDTLLWNL